MIRTLLRSPIVRLSLGLALLTVSLLLVSEILGLTPDRRGAELEARKIVVETFAVQLSTLLTDRNTRALSATVEAVVERSPNVLSAGVRERTGTLVAEAGGHSMRWDAPAGERSTPTHVRVPIFSEGLRWGTVEMRFPRLGSGGEQGLLAPSFALVIVFVAVGGFLAYVLFLRRALRELNPTAVIPDRVRAALDTLSEGLLILDEREQIVFANRSFSLKVGKPDTWLVGRKASELQWELDGGDGEDADLPWVDPMGRETQKRGIQVKLRTALGEVYNLTVNTTPITGSNDTIRGALVTFDDVTELERKNGELNSTLSRLEHSQQEITRQNRELEQLATRDPLTGCLNRRSMFEGFEALFDEAAASGEPLSCIMVDIDHFKSINDRFGHATGDKVIKLVATLLTESVRANDLVGRYGGEEFCIVLPGNDVEAAYEVAERMRQAVSAGRGARFTSAVRITASFGVSCLDADVANHGALLNRADRALYKAKSGGRNRTLRWTVGDADDEASVILQEACPSGGVGDGPVAASGAQAPAVPLPAGSETAALTERVQQLEQALVESERERSAGVQTDEGLPNRVLLFDRLAQALERARRYGSKIAVVALDVEGVQRVNDTLGHAAGEKFLRAVFERLRDCLRRTDSVGLLEQEAPAFTVSRTSGDEFVVLLTDMKRSEFATWVLKRVFDALKTPIDVEGTEVIVRTSIGVSVYPFDGQDPDTLISHAGAAMREARQQVGRDNYRFYSDDINHRCKEQLRLEGQLHRAIERGEFVLHYQPKVDLVSGQVNGVEALVRWQHPELGLIAPNDFIPTAEHTGMIEAIGDWVVSTACRQVRLWRDAGHEVLSLSVNLSPVQFRCPDLAARLIDHVDEAGLEPGLVEFEITERVVMQNVDTVIGIMEEFSDAGIRIAVDDFGTGYSSLAYLKRFPIHTLKIDRSFLTDFTESAYDAAIVSAIIAMGHSMGLRVVAEGVETREQLQYLHDLRCDEIQGYLISKPLPREGIAELLSGYAGVQRKLLAGVKGSPGSARPAEVLGILNDFSTVGAPDLREVG